MGAGTISKQTVAEAVSAALRSHTGPFMKAEKYIASRTKRNPRTVRNWLDENNAPGAAELIELMREFDEVHQAVLQLANRSPMEPSGSDQIKLQRIISILKEETHESGPDRIS